MVFMLAIHTPGGPEHSLFQYSDLPQAMIAVQKALDTGFHVVGDNVVIQTGDGTVYRVVSQEHMALEEREEAPLNDTPWKLVVQVAGSLLPPLNYKTEAEVEKALQDMVKTGVITHEERFEHVYIYIEGAMGGVYMKMDKEQWNENVLARERAAQNAAREAAAEEQERTGRTPGGIIMG